MTEAQPLSAGGPLPSSVQPRAMRDALLEKIWAAMAKDPKIYFLSADFGAPVLDKIRADFPDRFLNVGIAEQNLINVSAGLGIEGHTVFAYAIAPFITMRCFEQLRVNLALLSEVRPMNVNLIGVGAGYSYVVSGPTHQCYEDLTLVRALPNFEILSSADHLTASSFFEHCLGNTSLKYLRFDAQIHPPVYRDAEDVNLTDGYSVLREGRDATIIATGFMTHRALELADLFAQEGVEIEVIDLYRVTHFDKAALSQHLDPARPLISLEEGFIGRGGVDAMIQEFLRIEFTFRGRRRPEYLPLGVRPGYSFELGSREELHELVGIGPTVAASSIRAFLSLVADYKLR